MTFNRGATTSKTPKLEEFEILAENRLLTRRAWECTIDIVTTALQYAPALTAGEQAGEAIIADIEGLAEASELLTFRVGQMAQTLVRIPNHVPPVLDTAIVGSSGEQRGHRTGTITVRLEEVR